jgi:hypothetical protein
MTPSRPDALIVGIGISAVLVWIAVPSGNKLLHDTALADTPVAQYDETDNFGRIRRGFGRGFRGWFQRWCWRFLVGGGVEIAQ